MKKNVSILLLLLLPLLVYSQQGVRFIDNDFKKALELAKENNKIIFVDAYTDWCEPCKQMQLNTFTKEAVGKYYKQYYRRQLKPIPMTLALQWGGKKVP